MVTYEKKEVILSVKDVCLKYEDKQVLNNINFEVRDIVRPGITTGQIISILGASGSGKSSLFKLLSGYLKPNSGDIKVGSDLHHIQLGEIGVVPQDYPLFEHETVFNNLELALKTQTGKTKEDTIKSYAQYFDLSAHLEKYPCNLSGGQKQRVSILQQVLAGNRVILLDEPFSGLDSIMKDKVIDILIKVANLDELNTLVIVSHDIESAAAISDTVHVISNRDGNGSTIVKTYDLLQEGLAYEPGIKEFPRFRQIISEIKTLL